MLAELLTPTLSIVSLALPAIPVLALGLLAVFGVRAREPLVVMFFGPAFTLSWIASLLALAGVHLRGPAVLHLGDWFRVGAHPFGLHLRVDRLSAVMLVLTASLTGLVGRFSYRYMHREPGFLRFFLLLGAFQSAMSLVVLGDSLDLIFAGWEILGITSALLIGFFQERDAPARSGLLAFSVYRVCDIGLLLAAVMLHHHAGSARLDLVLGLKVWPASDVQLASGPALLVALCLLFAAMGKSAQFPLGGWLPRAMEGPTPSSAIFYGALSVHAGAYLLLRTAPLLDRAPLAAAAVVAVGLLTAAHGAICGRVQTDVKSALAYASVTQVGVIFVEIGLGLYRLALWHIVAHAILRAWQLLRSPSALHEAHQLRAAGVLTGHAHAPRYLSDLLPRSLRLRLYRFALERGYLDAMTERLVSGITRLALFLDRAERRWTAVLAGDGGERSEGGRHERA